MGTLGAMITVIDYRAGNAPSVMYALEYLNLACRLTSRADEIMTAERLILPGVGTAGATLASLSESGLIEPLTERVRGAGIPFLGICIGLQVLFDRSEEGDETDAGDVDGFGWIPGVVARFPASERVPQIGWNEVRRRRAHPLLAGLPDAFHCYFVNSFYAEPAAAESVIATTDYGVQFCSVAGTDNVVATQFHAEKSGRYGLAMLENFANWDGTPC